MITETSQLNGKHIVHKDTVSSTLGNKNDAQPVRQKNSFKRAKSDVAKNDDFMKSLSSNISKAPSFLRIYFQNSTAVVEKKKVSLKDLLWSKLISRNLDPDNNCVAYSRDSGHVIDWNIYTGNINDNDIIVDLKENIAHCFTKKNTFKIFSNRCCDMCKNSSKFPLLHCSKCDMNLCNELVCETKAHFLICRGKNSIVETTGGGVVSIKPALIQFGASLKQKFLKPQNNSEQILPIGEIKIVHNRWSISDPDPLKTPDNFDRNECEHKVEKINQMKPTRFDSLLSWQIPHNRIRVMENNKIGQGSFGTVYKATDANHGLVAVKYLSSKTNKDHFNEFKNEVTILQSTEHENILTFIGCLLNNRLAIVTEWCPGSSLYNHIHNYPGYDLWQMSEIVDISKQIATGMEYLHARNIIHCDLKSNNIFLVPILPAASPTAANDSFMQNEMGNYSAEQQRIVSPTSQLLKWKVKIGDFGVAKVKSVYEQEPVKNLKLDGSLLWMSPEVITQKDADPYTKKSDVYSYGVVLYELVASKLPFIKQASDRLADPMENFDKNNLHMLMYRIGKKIIRIDVSDSRPDTSPELKELILTCTDPEIESRLYDFSQIKYILSNVVPTEKKMRCYSFPNLCNVDECEMMDMSENRSVANHVKSSTAANGVSCINGAEVDSSVMEFYEQRQVR